MSINEENDFLQEESEQTQIRHQKLMTLMESGKNPYNVNTYVRTSYSDQILENFEELEGKVVSIAGRIMSRREMGKASFAHIQDTKGRIQLYFKQDELGEEVYGDFLNWDLGDIIGAKGFVFRTRRGEISVHVQEVTLLCKSLKPLPDKWHGLKDVDVRYRQRYLDLIVSPESKQKFVLRSAIIKELRNYLDSRDFLEVETPVLHNISGGATARPFTTHHNSLDMSLYLRIALELHLKRLIVGGFDKVYEIGRVFRNEGLSVRHNPEFTLLELYEAYTDYEGMMNLTEDMIRTVANKVLGTGKFIYNEAELDLDAPFARVDMTQAASDASGVDLYAVTSLEEAAKLAHEHHIKVEPHHTIGHVIEMFFEKYVEPNIVNPTFVMGHPVEISPFAKKRLTDPRFTERFELFIVGREFGNAFTELNDPIDQRERFMEQLKRREKGDLEAGELDEDFLNAMMYGMPPTGGLGVGVDRLVMLLTDSYAIRDILLFPTMKNL